MKPAILVVFCLVGILACAGFFWVEHQTQVDNARMIRRQLEAVMEQRDSLQEVYKLRGDSLQIAYETIRQANAATEKAHAETRIYRKKFEAVKFVRFETDSARNNALKKLYKTYKP